MADLTGALCAQTDPELFFPPRGSSSRTAQALCAKCPVREPCLEMALSDADAYGVWGGTTEAHRRKIRSPRRTA